MNQEIIDAGFTQARALRVFRAQLPSARDADFWRRLNPHLTISERPFAAMPPRVHADAAVVSRAARQIVDEGYLQTPPLVPAGLVDGLRGAAVRVVEAGFPPVFACVYDEFYQAFSGLDEVFAPLLGEQYRMVLDGMWTYCVPAGDAVYGDWTATSPHRDSAGPDPRVVAHDVPSIITLWIPLTDISPIDSCIYVVPAPCDPDYHTTDRRTRPERFRLQDVRALPAAAGSVLGWSTHLVHWGSRSSRFAAGPRVSVAAYFQRRDMPAIQPSIEFGAGIPFETRLDWIGGSLGMPGLWNGDNHE